MKHNKSIGLFGLGTVGSGLYKLISSGDYDFSVKKICVKQKGKNRPVSADSLSYDPNAIIKDQSIDLVVELVSDANAAYYLVKESLANGKPVISANKKMISEHLGELIELQKRYKSCLFYEGAVCGSIPIINLLNSYYSNDNIKYIYSICNGTTNYILTKVRQGLNFQAALKEAQVKGFAEADSSSDILGFDPRYKLTILLTHAFGLLVDCKDIFCAGIQNITTEDFDFARKKGYEIKLIAHALNDKANKKIVAYVMPTFVKAESRFSFVVNEYNAVNIEGEYIGEQFLLGKGAGSYPTSIAVLSDIQSILNKGQRYNYPINSGSIHSDDFIIKICVRYPNDAKLSEFKFQRIVERDESATSKYVVAEINLMDLKNAIKNGFNDVFILGYLSQ